MATKTIASFISALAIVISYLVQPEASLAPNSNMNPPISELAILTPCTLP